MTLQEIDKALLEIEVKGLTSPYESLQLVRKLRATLFGFDCGFTATTGAGSCPASGGVMTAGAGPSDAPAITAARGR